MYSGVGKFTVIFKDLVNLNSFSSLSCPGVLLNNFDFGNM